MKYYIIIDKETNIYFAHFNNLEEAKEELKYYEERDMEDGVYTPNFYKIIEMEEEEMKKKWRI